MRFYSSEEPYEAPRHVQSEHRSKNGGRIMILVDIVSIDEQKGAGGGVR